MYKKIVSSALALSMLAGTAVFVPETGNDGIAINAYSKDTKAPDDASQLYNYLSKDSFGDMKVSYDDALSLFGKFGMKNYKKLSLKEGAKALVTWWATEKNDDETYSCIGGYKSGSYYYSLLSDGTACIIGYDGTLDKLMIPETIDGKKVTRLGGILCMNLSYDKNGKLLGSAGDGGGGSFGGDCKYVDDTSNCKVYLSSECTVAMPTALRADYYCIKGSAAEKYLKENYFTYKYYKPSVKNAAVTVSNKTYTGKKITPAVTVKLSGKTLKKNKDYTLSCKNNKNCGKATVTVKGKGDYKGKLTKTFVIKPGKAKISKLTSPKTKQLKVKIKKSQGGVTGYQIAYSSSKKFAASKTKTISVKTTGKTVKGLKKGRTYYVKVRAYKTVGGKKYYGAYSGVKKISVK